MDVPTIFATLTILAQAVERIVELISDFSIWGDPSSGDTSVRHRRAILLWCISSALGAGICFAFRVDFFSVLPGAAVPSWTSWLHMGMSGIIVGSGTKPVHDLIVGIERFARKK